MSIVVACKLPHGLRIEHEGDFIELNGANVHTDPQAPSPNGANPSGELVSYGYGLTALDDKKQALFQAWENSVTKGADGKPLQHGFTPLENGSILTFKTDAEARRETKDMAGFTRTGFEGLDADEELGRAVAARPGLELEKGNGGKN